MKKISFSIFLIFCVSFLSAHEKIDSIKVANKTEVIDSILMKNYYHLGLLYSGVNNDSSIYFFNKSLSLEEKYTNLKLKAYTHLYLGNTYYAKGAYAYALENYLKVQGFGEQLNNDILIGATMVSIGVIYITQKEHEKATAILLQAESFYLKLDSLSLGRDLALLTIYIDLGVVYSDLGKYKKSLNYSKKAIVIAQKLDNNEQLSIVYNNIGILERKRGNYKKAESFLLKALNIREEINDKYLISRSNLHLGGLYYMMKDYNKAVSYLQEIVENFNEVITIATKHEASGFLHKTYSAQNLPKKAYKIALIHIQLSDSIKSEETSKQITELSMQYEFDIKQKAFKEKEKEKEELFMFIAIVLIVLIVFFILIAYAQRVKVQKSKIVRDSLNLEKQLLEEKLEFKNKKMMTNVMYLLKKNELIIDITNKLLGLSKSMKKENIRPVQDIINNLRKSVDEEVWTEFEAYFLSVHSQFFEKLEAKYELTPNERRMCAFLKLNMSSKEIATITGQTTRSIDVARYRLRKKLNINKAETTLIQFLSKF